jgi:MoaA/NifB/PqqE/SkfB family radical SAM enzyme
MSTFLAEFRDFLQLDKVESIEIINFQQLDQLCDEASFQDLIQAIEQSIDRSPIGKITLNETECGFYTKFQSQAVAQWMAERIDSSDVAAAFITAMQSWIDTTHQHRRFLCHLLNGAAIFIAQRFQLYEQALEYATSSYSLWAQDVFNHRLVIFLRQKRHLVIDNHSSNLRKFLDGVYCSRPFSHFQSCSDGRVYMCSPSYLPVPTGNINVDNTGDTWNSDLAMLIRRSIIAGTFDYCSPLTCPSILSRQTGLLQSRPVDSFPQMGLTEQDISLIEEDYFGYSIYYFNSRVYALPVGDAVDKIHKMDSKVEVAYSLTALARIIARRLGLAELERPLSTDFFDQRTFDSVVLKEHSTLDGQKIEEKVNESPTEVVLAHDDSCNISCPSCRNEVVIAKREVSDRYDMMIPYFLKLVEGSQVLVTSGSGDPFASRHFRRLLKAVGEGQYPDYGLIKLRNDFRINLMTNGLAFNRKNYDDLRLKGRVGIVALSIDAAHPITYETLRRGSKWPVLIDALRFMLSIRDENPYMLMISYFTIQHDNYRELPAFVELCKKYRFNQIQLNTLRNFGAWTNEEFLLENVADPRNSEYEDFLEVMRHPALKNNFTSLGNAKDFFDLANGVSDGV